MLTVSLPDSLQPFVDRQVTTRGFASVEDYLQALVRRDEAREALRDKLLSGAESPPTSFADDAYFTALRDRARSRDGE